MNQKCKCFIIVLFLFILTIVVRYIGKDFISGDMKECLLVWFDLLKQEGGINGLSHQTGDYNLSYQTLVAFLTYINFNPIYLIKISSVIFDYILAVWVALIINDYYREKEPNRAKILWNVPLPMWSFFAILFVPTIVVNSAVWGQCDAQYTSFCIGTLFFLRRKLFIPSAICLGFAFACKLQAIFILPFLCAYVLKEREYKLLLYIPITLFAFWITGIFAYIQGRDMLSTIELYVRQTGDYQQMYLNFASFWGIFGKYTYDYQVFGKPAVVITLLICLIGTIYYVGSKKFSDISSFYSFATWYVWTVVLFLPCMHERYAYMVDVLLVILCFINKRYTVFAILSICMSLWCYGLYFYGFDPPHGHPIQSFIYTLTYLSYSGFMVREQIKVLNR